MIYLGTAEVAAGTTTRKKFALGGSTSWSNNLLYDLGNKEELEKVMEGRFLWRQPRPQIGVILELIFFKNTLSNGLANPLSIKKLEL